MKQKILVAYFSASGITAQVAQTLAQAASADVYEIKPAVPYSAADLDWMNPKSRSSVEMKDPSSRPTINGQVANMADYDVIFVGFPIWWYVAPAIIQTFLESYDFSGKTIIPFATSGGSGLGRTNEKLQQSCPGATLRPGKLLNGRPSAAELKKWMESLNL